MKPTKIGAKERELSPEKTEAILTGAIQEFLKNGYAATTMDKIAAGAGVSKATVYNHFHDKEALFKAIIERMAQKKCLALHNPANNQSLEGEPGVVLRYFANNMLDSTIQDPEFLAFVRLVMGESERFPELARTFIYTFDQTGRKALSQYLASCSDLRLPDPDAASYIFIGSIVNFLIHQEIMHGKDVVFMDRDRFLNSLIHLMT